MKKQFVYALVAAVYIVFIVLMIDTVGSMLPEETILMPITMLGLFVLSAAIMGFLFLFEPIRLYVENQKQEAFSFFLKTVGIFAGFVILFLVLLFLL